MARSPEMKVAWLVNVFKKQSLTEKEIAPYMHLLLAEYESQQGAASDNMEGEVLRGLFRTLDSDVIDQMVSCTEIYDIPALLALIDELTLAAAVLVLKKTPPPYEKKALFVLDRAFQAVNNFGTDLLDQAAAKMRREGGLPDHFDSAYGRFKEILEDEKILKHLYPQAS